MEIAAVYLQPVAMDPPGMMRDAKASDIHSKPTSRRRDKNVNGFADGTWIPYLGVKYEISKQGATDVISGPMMPMVASDGPHYGDNVKLAGPGKYRLKLTIAPPGADPHSHFGRHVDKETGVGAVVQAVHASNTTSRSPAWQERWLLIMSALRRFAGCPCRCSRGLPALGEDVRLFSLVAQGRQVHPPNARGARRQALQDRDQPTKAATPIEFESRALKVEKVLAPGAKSSVVINPLKPGDYTFFDEFHQRPAKGTIVAK